MQFVVTKAKAITWTAIKAALLMLGCLGILQKIYPQIPDPPQRLLMPGIYYLNPHDTPLHYLPPSKLHAPQHAALYVRAQPMGQLQAWGTHYALVSQDTAGGRNTNSLVFLNAPTYSDDTGASGRSQTEPIYFYENEGALRILPSYGDNPLERPQNGTFNLQENWFSVYRTASREVRNLEDLDDTGAPVAGTVLRMEAAAFNLFKKLPLIQIIPNSEADSIPMYHTTDTTKAPMAWIAPSENLFVHGDTLNGRWLDVSRFLLLHDERVRLSASGKRVQHPRLEQIRAWVRQEDRYYGQWTTHIDELDAYRFEVSGASQEIDFSDRAILSAIKVVDKRTQETVQVITEIGAEIRGELSRSLTFVDANFDGYPDIMADFADGGAGPNYTRVFFVFNPEKEVFEYHAGLSALPQVEIDTVKQRVRSSWRSGAAQHGMAEYCFMNGTMVHIYQWDQTWESADVAQQVESILQEDGTWAKKVWYEMSLADETVPVHRKPSEEGAPLAMWTNTSIVLRVLQRDGEWYFVEFTDPQALTGWVQALDDLIPSLKGQP